ncbi:MAG: phenylalanine--tRNA ligase subunit beta [Firmicutes bacterium HGW-Firmicutes-21]|nr:MAG: phenylalanine--tRNA ligase subunit beta [Firmicutes bacterium HGW-Firmicutes-21]
MKVSLNWLRDYVNIDKDIREYCEIMTHSGTKVEGYEILADEISNVVAGRIMSTEPHSDSDHLVICRVDVGKKDLLQIVTGASNVKTGDIVPVCLDGATLPGGKTIKTGKMRGVVSEGMLCSLGELELTVNDFPYAAEDGIFIIQEECSVGDDIKEVLKLTDTVVDFELTFNRPDCLSYLGIARESAASLCVPLNIKEPVVAPSNDGDNINKHLSVRVENPVLCPRYTARMIKNVKIAPSPLWLRAKLRAAGVRPINNIVDITNFVMIEYGQPMHAFDYNYITSKEIIIRNATEGERITTLDGTERTLTRDMLCIADGSKPVALAGVMGGLNSEILDSTATVVFESANFNRESIRHTSRALGLRTESSAKFEKGLPACNTLPAIDRAVELVLLLGAGEVVDGVIDVLSTDIGVRTIKFDYTRINELLGTSLNFEEMASLLVPLGLNTDKDGNLLVPPLRNDIITTADIAEEVARLYGYDKIPETNFIGEVTEGRLTPIQKFKTDINTVMTAFGFTEICTYSFISPKFYDKINLSAESALRDGITLINPLGDDTSVMRTTALPSLLDSLSHNYKRRIPSCKLFENATVYLKNGDMSAEEKSLVFAFYGDGDFYDAKGYTEGIFDFLNLKGFDVISTNENLSFHPGRQACIVKDNAILGTLGQIHPSVAENFDIDTPVYAAVLSVPLMFDAHDAEKEYRPFPLYPAIERDLALITEGAIEAGALCKAIRSFAGKSLIDAFVFDVYKGKGIEEGKKSIAVRLTFRLADKTMTDEEADSAVKKILRRLDVDMGIKLRS